MTDHEGVENEAKEALLLTGYAPDHVKQMKSLIENLWGYCQHLKKSNDEIQTKTEPEGGYR